MRERFPPAPGWVAVGIGDDAAVVETERNRLEVLTVDAIVDGVHFDSTFTPPAAIGHRALAVNLSDLAAMGAAPRAALLSLVVPSDLETAVVDGMLDGILALAARNRVALVGGNIARSSGPLIVDITATGSVHRRRVLTRSSARPGDEVFVTGAIGGAAAGLRSLQTKMVAQTTAGGSDRALSAAVDMDVRLEERYLHPQPRVRAGLLLGRMRAATSCVDLSDGLADGVRQIAAASGVGIALDADAIPLDEGVREHFSERGLDPVSAAVAGGDDYELLFTVRPSHRGRLRGVKRHVGDLPIKRIGVVTKEPQLVVRTPSGDRDLPKGYEHFR
jgi:thiamine-monophosphate kinase